MRTYPELMEVRPRGPVAGVIRPPGSKSITNRALLLASLAEGESTVEGALIADDTLAMAECLRALGAVIEGGPDSMSVFGTGGRLRSPSRPLDARSSGTTARFLVAAVTLADGPVIVDGSDQLRARPMGDLVDGLGRLGCQVESEGAEKRLPIRVRPGRPAGGRVTINAASSSQFVSAIAMVGPFAAQDLVLLFADGVLVSRPYVVTTIEVMRAFGAEAHLHDDHLRVTATGGYRSSRFRVQADASAAVYPLVAAAVTGGTVRVEGLSRDSSQADLGVVEVLRRMGCAARWEGDAVTLSGPKEGLEGIDVDMNAMPDAAVAVAVAAAFARTATRITNVATLRSKESDRLTALETELRKLGTGAEAGDDWLVVEPGRLHGATVDTYDDHRLAMAFALAGLVVPGIVIRDPGCVAKTWPRFFEDLEGLWARAPASRVTAREEGLRTMEGSGVVVAVDGPGGAGKTTVSRGLARRLGIAHLDTGAFYRAATVAVLRAGLDPTDSEAVTRVVAAVDLDYWDGSMRLDGEVVDVDIRGADVDVAVSPVSAHPGVREILVARQRDWVRGHGGSAVVEGRDIGTVVFPDADLKVFLTARPEVRAARRAAEMSSQDVAGPAVAQDLARRDRYDSTRAASPLRAADDAVEVDTSDLSIDEVIDRLVRLLEERSTRRPVPPTR